jgi:hypothetical protein
MYFDEKKKLVEETDGTMAGLHNSVLLSYRMLQTKNYIPTRQHILSTDNTMLANNKEDVFSYKGYLHPTRTISLLIPERKFQKISCSSRPDGNVHRSQTTRSITAMCTTHTHTARHAYKTTDSLPYVPENYQAISDYRVLLLNAILSKVI